MMASCRKSSPRACHMFAGPPTRLTAFTARCVQFFQNMSGPPLANALGAETPLQPASLCDRRWLTGSRGGGRLGEQAAVEAPPGWTHIAACEAAAPSVMLGETLRCDNSHSSSHSVHAAAETNEQETHQ